MSVFNKDGDEINNAFSVDGTALADVYNLSGERIGLDIEPPSPTFLDTAVITALSSVSTGGVKQGCCTDGEYIYQAAGDSSGYTYMQIIKYKISDGTYTVARFDGTPNFGHANDMTYNPNNGYLYVCTMLSDGSIIVLDSTDLSYVETVYAHTASDSTYQVWQICFDRNTNHFYSAGGRSNYFIYDQNWNYLDNLAVVEHPNATGQGCETDGTYIYRVTYNPNYFDVIRLSDGERVKTITNPMLGEPEALAYDWDGHFYASRNTTGTIFYRVQLTE